MKIKGKNAPLLDLIGKGGEFGEKNVPFPPPSPSHNFFSIMSYLQKYPISIRFKKELDGLVLHWLTKPVHFNFDSQNDGTKMKSRKYQ